ncbi:MAG: type II toxin-antitoxin system HicA family toxin [Prevotellaceae bacterium]|jgi:predicted RNA binding protein YcfA (HicA-like mRNA interferase family)|nr:type II toxin-antitoxin system HicA family toxin [Prevotellaceae bacterium]
MKSTELHRKLIKKGWKLIRQDGTSHCAYEKNGKIIIVPYHGAKEVPTGTCKKILKQVNEL